ncbi:MAG: hypothetical protein EHM21_05110 [Chloroflexi bacterium]|nr:MAG: hypothetical protein EHM21_05110 [Chloroflexota bacterium]
MLALTLVAYASASPANQARVLQTAEPAKEVLIQNFVFTPPSLTIPVGTTVTWTNEDQAQHTATADDKSFDSGPLAQGASFSFTFTKEGTFPYICTFHPNMVGTIIVTK